MSDVFCVQVSRIQGLEVGRRSYRASATVAQSSTFFAYIFGKTGLVAIEIRKGVEVLIEDAEGCGKKA